MTDLLPLRDHGVRVDLVDDAAAAAVAAADVAADAGVEVVPVRRWGRERGEAEESHDLYGCSAPYIYAPIRMLST